MKVAEAVGRLLAELGTTRVFGVVGSGNFHVTNGLISGGAKFVAARNEQGAASMADAFARMSSEVGVLSVHQGCGLTNALTGITEAAKSRTPLLILSGEAVEQRSNFAVDQSALMAAVGAQSFRIQSAATAVEDLRRAFFCAKFERRTVLLNLPLDVQEEELPLDLLHINVPSSPELPRASERAMTRLVAALRTARRPVFIAGRGSRSPEARVALEAVADECGALLATGAVAKGLFRDHPWNIDVAGGFSSPLTAELISGADLVVGWGSALNMWTTRQGKLVNPDATLIQVDLEITALGKHRDVALAIVGDVAATAADLALRLRAAGPPSHGYRTPELEQRIRTSLRWATLPFDDDMGNDNRIDPRQLSTALDDILPKNRIVSIDGGNFMGYPSMYLSVPDENGFCMAQAFQSVGLGLATAIGAAFAQPERVPVAACGDGGFLMGIAELETAARLNLGMVVVVYNDHSYGAEEHHFGPDGYPLETVLFPETDIAAIARGYGCEGVTVRSKTDLEAVADLLSKPLVKPLVIDAKIAQTEGSWWLQEAFGH